MDYDLISIERLDLSVRSYNCLRRANVFTVGELMKYDEEMLLQIRNLGRNSAVEILDKIEKFKNKPEEFFSDDSCVNQDDYEKWIKTDDGKRIVCDYLKSNLVSVNYLPYLSAREYNLLMLSGNKDLSDIAFADIEYLMKIPMMDGTSANEIINSIKQYLIDIKDEITGTALAGQKYADTELTVESIIGNPQYADKVLEYVKLNDKKVCELGLSNRPMNCLLKNGYKKLSNIIFMTESEFIVMPSMGSGSVKEILQKIREYLEINGNRIAAFCNGDNQALFDDEAIKEKILALYVNNPSYGFSFGDFCENLDLPDFYEKDRLKKIIGGLLADKKIEYVDFRCYRVYIPFSEYLIKTDAVNEREKETLFCRLSGETLDSIGQRCGLTRERVRQIVEKGFRKIKEKYLSVTGTTWFDEDYYRYFFEKYAFEKSDSAKWLGLTEEIIRYFDMQNIKMGNKPLDSAVDDALLDLGFRLRIKNYLNRNKVLIDGSWVEKRRAELEEVAVRKFCTENVSFSDFCDIYNSFLESLGIEFDDKIYYTDEVKRSRENRLSECRFLLWKQNRTIRYYDVDAKDYSELFDTIALDSYENIEISTLKFMDDYPEIMKKYDVRDQYELHNLLKKTYTNTGNDIRFGKMPVIQFGETDRVKQLTELLEANAPISYDEFNEAARKEFGFEPGALRFDDLAKYYHDGFYCVDWKEMSADNMALLKEKLTDDFYFTDEIQKIYSSAVKNADLKEINPYNLKIMGFSVFSGYAIQNHSSLEAFFIDLFTKNDITNITPFRKRYGRVVMFSTVLSKIKFNRTVIEYEPDELICLRKLEKSGISLEMLNKFCDEVYDFVEDETYFSAKSLRDSGFKSELYDLGFSNWFYASLLAADERFSYGKMFSNIILYRGKTDVSIKSFVCDIIERYGSIDAYDLLNEVTDVYGCIPEDRYIFGEKTRNTKVYHDPILDRYYSCMQLYERELEETEVI